MLLKGKYKYLLVIFCLLVSCYDQLEDKQPYLKIIIHSPYSSFNEINIDSDGQGESIYGFLRYDKDNIIKYEKSFSISSEEKEIVDRTLNDLRKNKVIENRIMHDGYKYILIALGDTLFNSYWDYKALDGFFQLLFKHVYVEESDEGDFFQLFKQTLQ